MSDAYERIGLVRNPFVVESDPGVAEDLWIDRGHSTGPRASASAFVQVLGPKGAGKTSHLLRWRQQTPGPYRHLPPGWRRAGTLPIADIAYWDEADRSPPPRLRSALRRAARAGSTVVAGTHVDLTEPAQHAGLTVETIRLAPLGADDVAAFAERRIRAVAGQPEGLPSLTREEATAVAIRADRSWRVAADLLHMWAAEVAAESGR